MKESIQTKLESLLSRHEEIAGLLADPETQADQNKFRDLSQEYAQLSPIVACFQKYLHAETEILSAQTLLTDNDPEMRTLAQDELHTAELHKETIENELKILLLPTDPDDNQNIFLEIRAGTGGAEAALFSADLYRMYTRYAEEQRWKVDIISESLGEHGGYKEIILQITGTNVFSRLKFESGAHRVQRVPETESQGRIHTSACTVAVMPEVSEINEPDIDPTDIRVDTYRASGAGGQHVNKTDSAVRMTHLATGIVVECQDERSQHKNRARAMSLLKAKILASEREKQASEQAQTRRQLVGSGDRSDRIRTYNYPQGRISDHRINLTLYKLDEIMQGNLDQVIAPLIREYQADLLASISE